MFNEVTNPWLYFAAGFLLCFIIQLIGYAIYVSQKHAEDVDMRLVLIINTILEDGENSYVKYRVNDQHEAQQELNKYMFHMIESAVVRDPANHNRMVAKMDRTGRLIGV